MNNTETFLDYKRLIFSVAYDMLGTTADAEDVVQETYLKWMSADAEKVEHPKAFLVKIATNISINQLNSARKRREEYIGTWLPEPLAEGGDAGKPLEIYSALSVGMMVLLERLSPPERAVFLLKEIFSYDYWEISAVMEKARTTAARYTGERSSTSVMRRPATM